jgi:2-oxo-3-hexenedioate decarboxylase
MKSLAICLRAVTWPVLLLGLLGGVCAAHAADPDLDYIARLMREADAARTFYPDVTRINPALADEDLYAIQQRVVAARLAAGAHVGGYKGGLIAVAPIGGVLFAEGLRERPARVVRGDYRQLLIEAEVAFEFCTAVERPLADVAAVKAAVCRLRPAVELPDAALPDLDALKADLPRLARALIPNNMVTRDVALGEAVPVAAVELARLHVKVQHEGALLGERAPGAANEAMWEAVRWIVNDFALARGYRVAPGQIVIAGSLTGLHPGVPGHYVVDYGELGRLEFDVVE